MWHAQSAVPERRVVEVGSGGSSLDLSLCRAHPTITYLKPPLPGAVLNDVVFLEDGRLALQVALPDGEQQAWTLDPDSRLSSQRLGDVVAHAPLAVRPDGQSVAVLQARRDRGHGQIVCLVRPRRSRALLAPLRAASGRHPGRPRSWST